MTSRITTMLDIRDGDHRLQIGDGYTTFSIDPHGNKAVMFKTADLINIAVLFMEATDRWKHAKRVEAEANT